MKRKFKYFIGKIKKKCRAANEKIKWLEVTMLLLVIVGLSLMLLTLFIDNEAVNNFLLAIGTGVFTSALVSLFITLVTNSIEQKKHQNLKRVILSPLLDVIRNVYIHQIINLGEYRIRVQKKNFYVFPMEKTKELSDWFNELEKTEIDSFDDKQIEQCKELVGISELYYRNLQAQLTSLSCDYLFAENLITLDEYKRLKNQNLFEAYKKYLYKYDDQVSEIDGLKNKVRLMHCSLLIVQ